MRTQTNSSSRNSEAPIALRHFAGLSHDLICVAGTDGYFRWLSPRWTELLGFSTEELMTHPFVEFIHPADVPATLAQVQRLDSGIPTIHFENRYRTKSGKYRWLQWSATPKEGTIYAIARDVTEVREMQQRSEQRLRLLSLAEEVADLGHWSYDVAEAQLRWSERVHRMLGLPPPPGELADHLIDSPRVLEAFSSSGRGRFDEALSAAIRSRGSFELELELVRIDGAPMQGLVRGRIEQGPSGDVERVFGILQDVTKAHRMRGMLVRSERMASVGALAAGMAHQINNPLATVVTNLEHLGEELHRIGGISPPHHFRGLEETINDAMDGAQRVRRVVRGLRIFARADEERVEKVDLRHLLESCVQMSHNEIRHRATLVRELEPLPLVRGDWARLAQVFVNILVNAAQALPEGHADRELIWLRTRTDALGRAVIEIEDTGPGIDPAVRERIFEPFFTTKPIGVGTGLGLSLALSVVTGLGGELQVDGERGRGARFRVILPALEEDQPAYSPQRVSRRTSGKPRVLVVDDEELVRGALSRILRREYELVLAEDGAEALEHIDAGEEFDLILCDLMMPVMTGMEVYERLCATRPDLCERIVFITGGTFTQSGREFLSSVKAPRVEKPFDIGGLRALLAELLEGD